MKSLFDFRSWTIRTQLVLGMALCMATLGTILITVVPNREHEALVRAENERLQVLAETTAGFVFPGLDFQDPSFVSETIRLLFAQPDMYQVQVLDEDGNLFAEEGEYDPTVNPAELHQVSVPVEAEGRVLGRLVLTTKTESLRSTAATMRSILIWTVLLVIAMGIASAFVIARYIARPILQLQAATSAIAKGSLEVEVPVGSRNELGDLAYDFNLMVDALGRTTTSRDKLEHEVREREKALREVRKLKEHAEQASRSKSEFLANMSHEIRTPMNAIIGLCDLTLEGSLEDEARRHIEIVHRSSQNLLGIINDVLDLSKIEAGKLELIEEETDLAELISDLARQQSVVAETRELAVFCSIDKTVPRWVEADALRLRQILTNLVGNAIKFTSTGFIALRAQGDEQGDGTHLVFEIEDTGVGIPQDKIEHIFQPFEQADGSTTRNYGGTGLGLSITSRLIEMMGGTISVESIVGVGSKFRFSIPAQQADGPSEDSGSFATPARAWLSIPDSHARRALETTLGFWGIERAKNEEDATFVIESSEDQDSSKLRVRRLSQQTTDDAILRRPYAPIEVLRQVRLVLEPSSTAASENTPQTTHAPFAGASALLAEDNLPNQMVATRFLQKMGFEVYVAQNGLEAVELFGQRSYAIILMDWHMPAMNGLEATAKIRELETDSRTPILGLTASALAGDREICLEAGMDGYLSKPINRSEFETLISKHATLRGADEGSRDVA